MDFLYIRSEKGHHTGNDSFSPKLVSLLYLNTPINTLNRFIVPMRVGFTQKMFLTQNMDTDSVIKMQKTTDQFLNVAVVGHEAGLARFTCKVL
jgi:hypothetical protein